jgi:hypothetical protein
MSASSTTPEQWAAMSKLVHQFFNRPDAGECLVCIGIESLFRRLRQLTLDLMCNLVSYLEPFRERVDYEALGLVDYPLLIKKPMDLGLVVKKLEQKQYRVLYECADDVRLVWSNCMTYNADGSDFYILASNLSKRWEEMYSKTMADLGLTSPPMIKENKLSLEEKRAFAKNLYKITKDELGVVLVELGEKSPAAITKNAAEDEFEVNVDRIDPVIFVELTAYMQTCLATKKKNPKKASKTG